MAPPFGRTASPFDVLPSYCSRIRCRATSIRHFYPVLCRCKYCITQCKYSLLHKPSKHQDCVPKTRLCRLTGRDSLAFRETLCVSKEILANIRPSHISKQGDKTLPLFGSLCSSFFLITLGPGKRNFVSTCYLVSGICRPQSVVFACLVSGLKALCDLFEWLVPSAWYQWHSRGTKM